MLGVQVPPFRRCRSASECRCRQIRLLFRQNHLQELRVHRQKHLRQNRSAVEPVLTTAAIPAEELRWQIGGREAYCLGYVQRDKEIVEEHGSLRASRRSKMGAH
ncbi:hypothetical protein ACFX19_027846 [Malus domestica]